MQTRDIKLATYNPELDGLRALAVLGVLLFHLDNTVLSGGYLGVDVFFVLSGFLITRLILRSIESKTFSFFDFYIRRARRLLPALFASLLITLILSALILNPEHFEAAGQSGLYGALGVANIHFWLSAGYFDLTATVKPFIHYWSLGVEEQFYLIWPALIVFGGVIFGKTRAGLYPVVLVVIISYLALWNLQSKSYDAVFYLMPFRAWEFGLGAVLAYILPDEGLQINLLIKKCALLFTIIGLALIITSFVIVSDGRLSINLLMPVFGTAFVIMGGFNLVSKLILANPISVFLGKTSYSLYLYHWPVIVFMRYIYGVNLSMTQMICAAIISFLCAYLSYRFIETKFRKTWTSSTTLERAAVPAILAPIALALTVFSSHIWNQNGWTWRLPIETQDMLKVARRIPTPNCDRPVVSPCLFGAKGDKVDLAIIGDSHARALSGGLTSVMERNNLTGIAAYRGGMLPILDTDIRVARGKDRFTGNSNSMFKEVFSQNPEFIVLHARHSLYWHTVGGRNEIFQKPQYLIPFDGEFDSSIAATQRQFEDGMMGTIRNIKARGIKPIIVGPVPNPGVDPLHCISRPFSKTIDESLKNCHGFSREESLDRNAEVSAMLKKVARHEDVLYIDPTPTFCQKEDPTCSRIIDGQLVYRDDDHLSLFASRLLAARVIQGMNKMKQKEKSSK